MQMKTEDRQHANSCNQLCWGCCFFSFIIIINFCINFIFLSVTLALYHKVNGKQHDLCFCCCFFSTLHNRSGWHLMWCWHNLCWKPQHCSRLKGSCSFTGRIRLLGFDYWLIWLLTEVYTPKHVWSLVSALQFQEQLQSIKQSDWLSDRLEGGQVARILLLSGGRKWVTSNAETAVSLCDWWLSVRSVQKSSKGHRLTLFWRSKFSWVTFHESSTLVCQFLLLGQFIETSTMKGLPLVSVSKAFTSLL